MTDKQLRDRIVGVLSASMMPMAMEAESVAFLDRCLAGVSWHPAKQLPAMHKESYDDFGEKAEYQLSDPVLAYTTDGEMVVVRAAAASDGTVFWSGNDETDYDVTHWTVLPAAPDQESAIGLHNNVMTLPLYADKHYSGLVEEE